jgi:hypothetical protein
MSDEARPREYAEPIGAAMRDLFDKMILDVPLELRGIVEDHVVNGLAIEFHQRKARGGVAGGASLAEQVDI